MNPLKEEIVPMGILLSKGIVKETETISNA
jgi:hypothetical protein